GRGTRRLAAATAAGLMVTACAVGGSSGSGGSSASGACGNFDSAILNNRPVPASLDPATVTPPTSQIAVNNTANRMGAPQALVATLWSELHVTPAQVKQICG